MVGTADPYYNRKQVPDELIRDVGLTGLTPQEEHWNRERKYSVNGADVRRFSSGKRGSLEPRDDPYYGRRRLSKAEIADVGETGLTPEEEHLNRERKYSVNGIDVRKFSMSRKGGLEPQDDPYYSRKRVSIVEAEISGVGETGMTPAEQFEVRERKQSLFQLSGDPFDLVAGRHRQSVSGVASGASDAATRRRSSAVAPDIVPAMASHSGYHGEKLATIQSRPEVPPQSFNTTAFGDNGASSGSSGSRDPSALGNGAEGQHHIYHDIVTSGRPHRAHVDDDPDSVAPDEVR
ncbi:hypothetical protein HRR83_006944 [Exophiala dermatitidis]|nr:hypothetical protein HRR82_007484 [Exophiala dermatitidis]KAJ4579917.1 hypothetical protein HRR81_002080 [Exophiala dermatitidis]KAJ4592386.1 hypothetical protein HRR83_006944 [Exophiala dermatitidis]KAJ4649519.1 hypothetical protein HRR90_006094 [Exophiala dermatitidis]KAJ4671093.1 hypothetical protein HRR93_005575 [Exophiala dermatitidis]